MSDSEIILRSYNDFLNNKKEVKRVAPQPVIQEEEIHREVQQAPIVIEQKFQLSKTHKLLIRDLIGHPQCMEKLSRATYLI